MYRAEQLSGLPIPPGVDEKVNTVYKGVGLIMKRFTTGKVPKAFKIIPNLQNWEEVGDQTHFHQSCIQSYLAMYLSII